MSRRAIVAVIGRPNVGKSSFFNWLSGQRLAIVDDQPGVTRDRLFAQVQWQGRSFTLIDTGGIEPSSEEPILQMMRHQADLAIEMSDLILMMVDLKEGLTAADHEIATMLRKSGKKVLLLVNKCDDPGPMPYEAYDFYQLGLHDVFAISAAHRLGLGEVLDAVAEHLPEETADEDDQARIAVAIIGRPNAGKSSLLNRLSGEDRAIVSDVAGTTRDSLDSKISNEDGDYLFIDTAGLRKKSRIIEAVERYSTMRAMAAIERSDVCLILIDAEKGLTEQDSKVAGLAHRAGKACILVVNKWDLIEKESDSMLRYKEDLLSGLKFMQYAPIHFISALTGRRCRELYGLINKVYANACQRITTGVLNDFIAEAQAMVPAPQYKGKRLKISYATQVAIQPPEFLLFVNSTELLHFSYDRYLENQLRRNFGFEGTPIRLTLREKSNRDQVLPGLKSSKPEAQ